MRPPPRSVGAADRVLPTAPGPGRAGARAFVESTGLARIGARVELGPGRKIGLGRFDFQLSLARSPFFPEVPHGGFVVLSGGLVDFEIGTRPMRGAHASDPFARDGKLRALLRVAAELARVGSYVWRPVSGGAVPADFFLEEVGDIDEPP